jgi:hypothetical protein
MSKTGKLVSSLIVTLIILAILVDSARWWIRTGCPVGFAVAACSSGMNGREISLTSDHLLADISMNCSKEFARIEGNGHSIEIRSNRIVVGKSQLFPIPIDTKRLEFSIRGDRLKIRADGTSIATIR